TSRAYADVPVQKEKGGEYSLARWQIDAHASWKSSGDTLLLREDIAGLDIGQIRAMYRKYGREHVYDYKEHVAFAEKLEDMDKLPKTFMAID
ncbi:hypothetical protein, partial [Bacillus cereus group sp. BC243]|uniref:hypothetical protein n=1 Tax=Bacillus cereus group sp. BC243 TaxID=3445332 RepID=UPI003F28A060